MPVGRRFLHGMSTRLYQQQHRSNTKNKSTLSQLYHYGLHFHHQRSFSTSQTTFSLVSCTDKKPLTKDILLFCRRDLHCQHSLGKPTPQRLSFTFLLRFPTNHHQQNITSHRNSYSCFCFNDKHSNNRCTSTSFSSVSLFSYYYSSSRNMSSLHLAKGSACPPLQDGKIRIYNMKFCPFAQRALLVAEAKGLSYDIVNCHLNNKPEWLLAKNPDGKVPTIETNDGKILYESLIVSDYFDEVYPQRPLHPKDAHKKALDRIFVEKFGSVIPLFYKVLFAIRDNEPDAVKQERIAAFVNGLKPFEEELSRRGTVFFGGNDQPAMLDYMIWPWIERIPAIKSKVPDLFDYDAAKTENPNLEKWRQAMKKDPAVSKFLLSPELHLKFMESFLSGSPNYDLQ